MKWILSLVPLAALSACGKPETPAPPPSARQVVDPICKMKVPQGGKYKATHDGKEYFFCNPKCLESFQKEPAKYATGTPECACAEAEQPCKCGHCASLTARKEPTEACVCLHEGEEKEHKH